MKAYIHSKLFTDRRPSPTDSPSVARPTILLKVSALRQAAASLGCIQRINKCYWNQLALFDVPSSRNSGVMMFEFLINEQKRQS